jgi:tRNA (adenine37-N6)-methyltransferase
MKKIEVVPIGIVSNNIDITGSASSSEMESLLILADELPEVLFDGLEFFSHLEIIYYLDLSKQNHVLSPSFQENRSSYGTKLFGTSIVKLVKREGKTFVVKGLDAINGTFIIDIKPVMDEFLPKEAIIQPEWSKRISRNY